MAIPWNNRVVVESASQRVRLSDVRLQVRYALIQTIPTNTGIIVLGSDDVVASADRRNSITLAVSEEFQLPLELGPWDLQQWWMDATVDGEGIVILAFL